MQAVATSPHECWKCHAELAEGLACPRCEAVQPLDAETDLFAVLGLPRQLAVDVADVEHRYHARSRAVHPDRHQTAGARERDLSLAASAALNRAYRTLRDPVARGRYWLDLHGSRLADEGPRVPPGIAAEVFETQEKLEELRADRTAEDLAGDVRALHERFVDRLAALVGDLEGLYPAWDRDGGAPLDELRRRLSEIAYLRTLLGDIEDALGEGLRGTNHRH